MSFGEWLRTSRKNAGVTQIELAEMSGVAVNSIRLYESEKRIPSLQSLAKIARTMNLHLTVSIEEGSEQDEYLRVDENEKSECRMFYRGG